MERLGSIMLNNTDQDSRNKNSKLEHLLKGIHGDLAEIFSTSIAVLENTQLGDRIRLVSYSYREIFNWLYTYVVKPGSDEKEYEPSDIFVMTKRLANSLDYKVLSNLMNFSTGEILLGHEYKDDIKALVKILQEFKENFDERQPRSERDRQTIIALAGNHSKKTIEDRMLTRTVKEYTDHRSYYNDILHKKINTVSLSEFHNRVDSTKSFLIRIIKYDAHDVFKNILALISECENDR